jgi:uncharacterized iron-regulated protein
MFRITLVLFTLLLAGCAISLSDQHSKIEHLDDYQFILSGKPAPISDFNEVLTEVDVIIVGEFHSHSAIHRFQTEMLQELHQNYHNVALAMEQFDRDKQSVIDSYLKGEMGEAKFIADSDAWSNYRSDYRPLIEFAKSNDIDVIAANAPQDLVRCINRQGIAYLDKLDADDRKQIAAVVETGDSPYKQKFKQSMHHGSEEQIERLYAAQISRDETMAESIVLALSNDDSKKILFIAGKFHTEGGLGVAAAIERRDPSLKLATIEPVYDINKNDTGQFQLLVQPLPKAYLEGESVNVHFGKPKVSNSDCL